MLSDIGFEVCSPSQVISDQVIEKNLTKLTSLRIWNEVGIYQNNIDCEKNNTYAITDKSLFNMAKLFFF